MSRGCAFAGDVYDACKRAEETPDIRAPQTEAAICEGITGFEHEYMGRRPKHIHAHLIGDQFVVRLQGVLTAAEQQLAKTLPPEKGRDLLNEVRTQLIETARSVLKSLVLEAPGAKVVSLHHDISVVTGEEVVLFTLAERPAFRETRRKSLIWVATNTQEYSCAQSQRIEPSSTCEMRLEIKQKSPSARTSKGFFRKKSR